MLHPLVAEYQRAVAAQHVAAGGYASLEAYLATRVIQEGLRACGRDVGRACLLQTLATRTLDLPGLKVQFGSKQRQSKPFVDITMLDAEGRFRR
jgi:ABC-type branched-subunit amino acid transport system substrate-binding protein